MTIERNAPGIRMATKRLIDSVWALIYEIIDEDKKLIRILHYSRDVAAGYYYEKELLCIKMNEDDNRIVKGVWLRDYMACSGMKETFNDDNYYTVINSKHIFDYGA